MAAGETTAPGRLGYGACPRSGGGNVQEVHVKRLPIWIVGALLVLGLLTTYVGWIDRHEVGYLPLALGMLWTLFALAAAPKVFADD